MRRGQDGEELLLRVWVSQNKTIKYDEEGDMEGEEREEREERIERVERVERGGRWREWRDDGRASDVETMVLYSF